MRGCPANWNWPPNSSSPAALLDAVDDVDVAVRRAAADSLREVVEVLPHPEAARALLTSADAVVRAVSIYLLAARRVGGAGVYRRALDDVDHRVRIEALRALVSIDDAAGVAAAAGDDSREVRVAAATAWLRCGQVRARSALWSPTRIRWCARLRWPNLVN